MSWRSVTMGTRQNLAAEEKPIAWTCEGCKTTHYNPKVSKCRNPRCAQERVRSERPAPNDAADDTRFQFWKKPMAWDQCWGCGKKGHVLAVCRGKKHRGGSNKNSGDELDQPPGLRQPPNEPAAITKNSEKRKLLIDQKMKLPNFISSPETLEMATKDIDEQLAKLPLEDEPEDAGEVSNKGWYNHISSLQRKAFKAARHLSTAEKALEKITTTFMDIHARLQEQMKATIEKKEAADLADAALANATSADKRDTDSPPTQEPGAAAKQQATIDKLTEISLSCNEREASAKALARYKDYTDAFVPTEGAPQPVEMVEWLLTGLASKLVEVMEELPTTPPAKSRASPSPSPSRASSKRKGGTDQPGNVSSDNGGDEAEANGDASMPNSHATAKQSAKVHCISTRHINDAGGSASTSAAGSPMASPMVSPPNTPRAAKPHNAWTPLELAAAAAGAMAIERKKANTATGGLCAKEITQVMAI